MPGAAWKYYIVHWLLGDDMSAWVVSFVTVAADSVLERSPVKVRSKQARLQTSIADAMAATPRSEVYAEDCDFQCCQTNSMAARDAAVVRARVLKLGGRVSTKKTCIYQQQGRSQMVGRVNRVSRSGR